MSWVTNALLAGEQTGVASQGQMTSSWLAVVLAFYLTFPQTWKHLALEGHTPLSFQAVVSWLEPEWRGSR